MIRLGGSRRFVADLWMHRTDAMVWDWVTGVEPVGLRAYLTASDWKGSVAVGE